MGSIYLDGGRIHIRVPDAVSAPELCWPTFRRKVFTSCCARWERPSRAVYTIADYYDGCAVTIRCARGYGCSASPRLRNGAYLREMMHYA